MLISCHTNEENHLEKMLVTMFMPNHTHGMVAKIAHMLLLSRYVLRFHNVEWFSSPALEWAEQDEDDISHRSS